MCQLLETIKILHNQIFNIDLHNKRLNDCRQALWGCKNEINLLEHIVIPENLNQSTPIKCRIVYSEKIESITYETYIRKEIKSLKIVHCDSIDYTCKWLNRDIINGLFMLKAGCDDIIIVKNGFITDTSYCNIVVYDEQNYFTSSTPLLRGTKRQQYIQSGLISEIELKTNDLKYFSKIFLINAMIDLPECEIDMINVQDW